MILLLSWGHSQSNYLYHASREALITLPSIAWQSLFFKQPRGEGVVASAILQIHREVVLKARRELCIIQPNTDWDISLLASILCV